MKAFDRLIPGICAGGVDITAMVRAFAERFLPSVTVQFKPAGGEGADLAAGAPFTESMEMKDGRAPRMSAQGRLVLSFDGDYTTGISQWAS